MDGSTLDVADTIYALAAVGKTAAEIVVQLGGSASVVLNTSASAYQVGIKVGSTTYFPPTLVAE